MIPFNPWWVYHCAGNLDPENDPYSDDYEYSICGFSITQLILTLFISFVYSGLYRLALYYIIYNCLLTNNYFTFFLLFLIDISIYVTLLIITLDKILK